MWGRNFIERSFIFQICGNNFIRMEKLFHRSKDVIVDFNSFILKNGVREFHALIII